MSAPTWQAVYLRALGAKVTPAAVDFLSKWQPWEGGHTNGARYNYLNTTQNMPGSRSINSVGVQSYGSLAQGAQAFAKTLKGRAEYAPLLSFLQTGQGDPTPGLSEWLSGSTTSPHGLAYAAKIMGTKPTNVGPTAPLPNDTAPNLDTGVTPTAAATADTQASQLRDMARTNLQGIAAGTSAPTEQLDAMAGLMRTLKSSVPTVQPPAPDPATGKVSALDQSAVSLAKKYIGVAYKWGGTSATTGFDCSGLIQTVYKQLGVDVPRTSQEQYKAGTPVDQSQLKAGDAVFFVGSDGTAQDPGHEGMYIGDGKFIEAPHSGTTVRISVLAGRSDYVGARRFT